MKTSIQLCDNLERVIKFFYKQLKLDKFENNKGRKLEIDIAPIGNLLLAQSDDGRTKTIL